jgi:hypothetical protein
MIRLAHTFGVTEVTMYAFVQEMTVKHPTEDELIHLWKIHRSAKRIRRLKIKTYAELEEHVRNGKLAACEMSLWTKPPPKRGRSPYLREVAMQLQAHDPSYSLQDCMNTVRQRAHSGWPSKHLTRPIGSGQHERRPSGPRIARLLDEEACNSPHRDKRSYGRSVDVLTYHAKDVLEDALIALGVNTSGVNTSAAKLARFAHDIVCAHGWPTFDEREVIPTDDPECPFTWANGGIKGPTWRRYALGHLSDTP